MNKQPGVYLVCNAHLDPVWLWEWEEGAAAAVSTFRCAADLCEEFDGFVFNHNEVILYRWVEEFEPALFRRIQDLVRQGKWHIMGGWFLQPDCNMPSGESLVRQIVAGRRYFSDRFGVEPTTAINFDPFGHSRGLPQILARSGYDSYLFCRPSQQDCPLPSDQFTWVGFDGSEVTACRAGAYLSSLGGARAKVESTMAAEGDHPPIIVLWGVGDHGGGPSRQDLRDLAALIAEHPGEIVHSTPEAYFTALRASGRPLPKAARDLNPWAVGCYTSMVRVKQKHRQLENALYSLEKMACAAWTAGLMPYPESELDQALNDLLTSEFHDILPGSSIQPVEDAALRGLDHGLELVSRARTRAFFALASGQRAADEGEIPILVYNPHPFPVPATVECEFQLADQNWTDEYTDVAVSQDGVSVPAQVEKEEGNLNLDWRKRVVFSAMLAPSGMSRFDCRTRRLPSQPTLAAHTEEDTITVAGNEMEVAVNTRTGLLDRFAVHGVDYLGAGAFLPVLVADNEDPWGMTVRSFRKTAGRFRLMTPRAAARFAGVRLESLPPVRVIEDGPVRTVIEALFACEESAICQRYRIPKCGTEIEVETRVHWRGANQMLKLAVPVRPRPADFLGQVAYGAGELPANGDEAVAQKWVAVVARDRSAAVTLINDGIYGYDYCRGALHVSLLRAPAYSGHPIGERPVVRQDAYTPRIDQGERVFRMWLNAGPARQRLEVIDREALAHNEKPFALSFFPPGGGTAPGSFALLDDPAVQLTALKRTDDGNGLIARLFEPTGCKRSTVLRFPSLGIATPVELAGFEIRTLRIDLSTRSVAATDLLERPLQLGDPR